MSHSRQNLFAAHARVFYCLSPLFIMPEPVFVVCLFVLSLRSISLCSGSSLPLSTHSSADKIKSMSWIILSLISIYNPSFNWERARARSHSYHSILINMRIAHTQTINIHRWSFSYSSVASDVVVASSSMAHFAVRSNLSQFSPQRYCLCGRAVAE